jgi:hypothetical protein
VRRGAAARAALVAMLLPSLPLGAQRAPARPAAVVPELRVDGAFGREDAVTASAGVFVDAGLYTRLGLLAGGGLARIPGIAADDGDQGVAPVARIEALARFHLDPLRQSRRGVYAGGGIGLALRETQAPRYALVALLGVEGAPRGGMAPAVEVGLGGGVRVAVALRRARTARR